MNEPRSIPCNHNDPRASSEIEWRLHANAAMARREAEREEAAEQEKLRNEAERWKVAFFAIYHHAKNAYCAEDEMKRHHSIANALDVIHSVRDLINK